MSLERMKVENLEQTIFSLLDVIIVEVHCFVVREDYPDLIQSSTCEKPFVLPRCNFHFPPLLSSSQINCLCYIDINYFTPHQ